MSRTTRTRARRALAAAGAAAAVVALWAVPSSAQVDPPPAPPTNFSMAGIKDLASMQALAVDRQVTGTFAFCNNPNGLGAELYLDGGDATDGMTVRHATVTPFVVPIHVGLLKVYNPDPDNPVDEEMLTLGVAQGTPIEFGQTGNATAEYGGVFFGSSVGMVSWNYSNSVTCTNSLVMPIIQPLINGGGVPTTVAPTTVAPTTTEAPTTTTTLP